MVERRMEKRGGGWLYMAFPCTMYLLRTPRLNEASESSYTHSLYDTEHPRHPRHPRLTYLLHARIIHPRRHKYLHRPMYDILGTMHLRRTVLTLSRCPIHLEYIVA